MQLGPPTAPQPDLALEGFALIQACLWDWGRKRVLCPSGHASD